MKGALLIVGGLLAIGALMKKKETVGSTGLSPKDYVAATQTDLLGPGFASWILDAPDATTALNRGNAVIQAQSGLDLTSPVWKADMGDTVDRAAIAVQVVNSAPTSSSNPYTDQGGTYPRVVNGILVQNPNVMEVLRIAWDNAQQGHNR